MKRNDCPVIKKLVMGFITMVVLSTPARAQEIVYDPVNAIYNQIRNTLMQVYHVVNVTNAFDQLLQLQQTFQEIQRFNNGIDEVRSFFSGDVLRWLSLDKNRPLQSVFNDFGWITPQIELMQTSSSPGDIRYALENITGEIPNSEDRPYIPFEEMHVVEGFQLAQEIRNAGYKTREAAASISEQAKTASPKGAARLQAEALSQVLLLSQQNQETMAKLIELEAVQVEQVSREEKRLETERLKHLDDAQSYLDIAMQGSYAS